MKIYSSRLVGDSLRLTKIHVLWLPIYTVYLLLSLKNSIYLYIYIYIYRTHRNNNMLFYPDDGSRIFFRNCKLCLSEDFYIWVSVHHKSIIYNKPTRCNSGSIVFINNYKYPLHVSDAICVHHQEHYKLWEQPLVLQPDKHQWLLLQFIVLLIMDAKGVRNM